MHLFLAGPFARQPLFSFLSDGHLSARPAFAVDLELRGSDFGLAGFGHQPGARLPGQLVELPESLATQRINAMGLGLDDVMLDVGTNAKAPSGPNVAQFGWDEGLFDADFRPLFEEALPELSERLSDHRPAYPSLMMPLSRAAARITARTQAEGPGTRNLVEVMQHTAVHRGFFNFDTLHVALPRLEDGSRYEIIREVFGGTDAVIVLPYDPKTDQVLLVEQFRTGPFVRGNANPWIMEPVAGLVDPGETPEATAHREAAEEAGIILDRLIRVGGAFPSPGLSSEFYHLFVALADLSKRKKVSGLVEEGEDIRSHVIPAEDLFASVDRCEQNVLPLLTLALWLRGNRDDLRSGH